jgi:AGCS family alanine or glycine:cation symporter
METAVALLNDVNGIVWGPITLILLLGTGFYLTVGLRFMPIRRIGTGFRLALRGRRSQEQDAGDITPFQALTTALSATIGTGNIAGVATAIVIGGPGAIFWMWITALVGMATKYAEAVLAVKFRETDERGRYVGGPMYYIKNGLGPGWKWLGVLFALFAMFAGFGIGNMFQANAVAGAVEANLHIPTWITGLILAGVTFAVIIGGIKNIGYVAERLVPFMALVYVGGALIILALNAAEIPAALSMIVSSAFTPSAPAGGFAGAAIWMALRYGVARGIFSNEAGLGSAAIAHAAAKTNNPVRQGTIAMLGTFIDTIIVCTMTALVILTVQLSAPIPVTLVETSVDGRTQFVCPTGDQSAKIADGNFAGATKTIESTIPWQSCINGAPLSARAFGEGLPFGEWIVTFGLIVFAFTTVLGWSYYGERSAEFLFGPRVIMPYRIAWVVLLFVGSTRELSTILLFSDTMNALMAAPNLIALLLLSGVVFATTRETLAKSDPYE